jgi:hypothetical protein
MTDTEMLDYLADYVAGVRYPNDGSTEIYLLDGQVVSAKTLREAVAMAVLVDQNYVYTPPPTGRFVPAYFGCITGRACDRSDLCVQAHHCLKDPEHSK